MQDPGAHELQSFASDPNTDTARASALENSEDTGHQVYLGPGSSAESQPVPGNILGILWTPLLFLASSSIGQAWGKLRDVDSCSFFSLFELRFEWKRMLKWGLENSILLWEGRSP